MQQRSFVSGYPQQARTVGQPQQQPSSQVVAINRPQVQSSQQGQPMSMMMNDPEAMMMMQVMQSFGSMGLGGLFGSGPLMAGNPFDAFFGFSDMHQQLNKAGEEGTFVFQAQMTSIEMGPDGRPIIENYFQNNLGQHMNGQTISEKQQAYKNTAGMNRIAEERMLNNQGRKIIKQKHGNDIEETHHYFNIEEEQAREFDNNWERVNQQNRFIADHGRYLGYANSGPAMIQMGQPTQYQVQQPRRIEPQAHTTQSANRPAVQYGTSSTLPQQPGLASQTIYGPVHTPPASTYIPSQQLPGQQAPVNTSRLAQNPFFARQQQSTGSAPQQPNMPIQK